ncbi:MAG: marine proteobacterial sortase target protein, partial [Halieaceae bacterium]
VAVASLEQTFVNNSQDWVEGVYAFPLPETAAVRRLEIEIGERKIIGKIREKAQAKAIYQAAKKAGKKASLVEQQRPNLFTNRVANIAPGESITVRLEYVQRVSFRAGKFSLRFPMTITPRYMPGAPLDTGTHAEKGEPLLLSPSHGWAHATDQVPDAAEISPMQWPQPGSDRAPHNPIVVTASLDMGMPLAEVDSAYHELSLSRSKGRYDITLAAGVSEMDRGFVLNWQPVTGASPRAALFTEQVGDDYFGLLMVVPPILTNGTVPPREVVFVIDTSGSMGGVSIEQARASVSQALQQLRPEDRFNIIEFNSNHRSLFNAAVPASRHHVQRAQEFVRQLEASGGTEMLSALRAALKPTPYESRDQESAVLRQVVFVTDGAVGNELSLFEEIAASLGDTRLFTVGIGSAPNSWFMRKAADFGRGTHTHIGNLDEVAEKMGALFAQLASPAAVNLAIDWPQPVESWPERVPDLYLGEPVVVAVSFGDTPPTGELTVTGELAGSDWNRTLALYPPDQAANLNQHAGVASLWARQKITGLLDQKVLGRTDEQVRDDVLPVALRHQLLSPYTSFVAVEEVVSRPAAKGVNSKPVPNSRPRGQSPQSFAYPRTATTGPAKAYLGSLLLFIALMIRVMRQGEVDHVAV